MSPRRAQNIFMPKNINSITGNIALEGTGRIKTEKKDNKTVWTITQAFTSWMAFIFPSIKMHKSWLDTTKSCYSSFQKLWPWRLVFTGMDHPLTFEDLLPLVEKTSNLDFLCCLLCFHSWFGHENAARQRREHSNGFSIFIGCYIVRLFDSLFPVVYFSGLKYILACQILHFSPQNAP